MLLKSYLYLFVSKHLVFEQHADF
ncbi:uncharacterized protein METZ01_LOCUS501335, partial [marine metagenome]